MKHIHVIGDVINSISGARKAKRLSQAELGKRIDLPQSYISRLESGRLDARLSSIVEIARYLGLEIMLVPVSMVSTVTSVIGSRQSTRSQLKPLYTLDDLDEDESENSQ